MIIKLEISGWFKTEDVSPEQLKRGYVEVEIFAPMNLLVQHLGKYPQKPESKVVRLWHVGTSDGLPHFQYK